MSETIYGPEGIIFGKGHCPKLPGGWQAQESADDWLKAVDKTGRLYFIGKHFAHPAAIATERDVKRTHGRLRVGDIFMTNGPKIDIERSL